MRLESKLMSGRLPQSVPPTPVLPAEDPDGPEEVAGGGCERGWLPFCCWGVAAPPCCVDGVKRPGKLGGLPAAVMCTWLESAGCCWTPGGICSPGPVDISAQLSYTWCNGFMCCGKHLTVKNQ